MGSPSSPKIIELRQMLEEQKNARTSNLQDVWKSGDPLLDALNIPKAALTEIVADPFRLPGGALLLQRFLHLTLSQQRVVLIDAKNAFDPHGFPQGWLDRLLWLRCPDAFLSMKAADLVLRDGNISFAILLFLLNPAHELKKIPSQAWHRLQLLTEKSGVTFLVFTPFPQIGSARLRLTMDAALSLNDLDLRQENILAKLQLQPTRRRLSLLDSQEDHELRRASCA